MSLHYTALHSYYYIFLKSSVFLFFSSPSHINHFSPFLCMSLSLSLSLSLYRFFSQLLRLIYSDMCVSGSGAAIVYL